MMGRLVHHLQVLDSKRLKIDTLMIDRTAWAPHANKSEHIPIDSRSQPVGLPVERGLGSRHAFGCARSSVREEGPMDDVLQLTVWSLPFP